MTHFALNESGPYCPTAHEKQKGDDETSIVKWVYYWGEAFQTRSSFARSWKKSSQFIYIWTKINLYQIDVENNCLGSFGGTHPNWRNPPKLIFLRMFIFMT